MPNNGLPDSVNKGSQLQTGDSHHINGTAYQRIGGNGNGNKVGPSGTAMVMKNGGNSSSRLVNINPHLRAALSTAAVGGGHSGGSGSPCTPSTATLTGAGNFRRY
jgi:hypothetical protein